MKNLTIQSFLLILTAVFFIPTTFAQGKKVLAPPPKSALHEAGPLPVARYDPARDPAKDLKTAISLAESSGKRILLDVGGEWCIWCHRLDDFFELNPSLLQLRDKDFVMLKINVSQENMNQKFLSHYPSIAGYPHLFVLDTKGKLLHSQGTDGLEKGNSYNPKKLESFLNKWAPRTDSGH